MSSVAVAAHTCSLFIINSGPFFVILLYNFKVKNLTSSARNFKIWTWGLIF